MAGSSLPAPKRRRLLWLLPVLALAALTAVASRSAEPVSAHALLVRADPPVNAQLREPPTELTLYFSEPLERKFSGARVVDQDGERADERVEFDAADDAALHVFLKPLSPGYVTVIWETVSTVDGHRVSGLYPLTILNPDGSVPAGQPAAAGTQVAGTGAKPERIVDKFLLLVGGALLVGAFAFRVGVTPALPGEAGARARRAVDERALVVAGASVLMLVAAGAGEILLQAANLDVGVADVLETRWGERWLLRNAALLLPVAALTLLAFARGQPLRRWLAGVGLAGSAVYLAVTASVSHSAAGGGAFWAAASDFIHLLAVSVWIGMLALLAALFLWARRALERGERYAVLAAALQRFSAIALGSVALLLATGTLNAVIEVGRLADLVDTGYGRALLVKLLLLAPLLGIGALNAYLLRPRLVEEAEAGGRRSLDALGEVEARLARTVRWELAVALGVLLAVAVLVQLTPTRGRLAAPAQAAGKYTETLKGGDISATLVVDPNEPGINTFEVYLTGAVDTVERVRLDFAQAGTDAADSRLILDATNPPTLYVGRGPFLTEAGKWQVTVDVRRTTEDMLIRFPVRVGGPGAAGAARSGGAFAAPPDLSPLQVVLIGGAAALCAGIVFASLRPAGIVGGYLSLAAEAASERLAVRRLRPVWSLALLLAVGIGLGAIVGAHVHSNVKDAGENPVASSPESIARGEMLFLTNCSQCHGESGRGDGPLAASLPLKPANLYDHVPYHPDQFFFNVITNGVGGVMPAFKNSLSEDDRWNILNYLRATFKEQPVAR